MDIQWHPLLDGSRYAYGAARAFLAPLVASPPWLASFYILKEADDQIGLVTGLIQTSSMLQLSRHTVSRAVRI